MPLKPGDPLVAPHPKRPPYNPDEPKPFVCPKCHGEGRCTEGIKIQENVTCRVCKGTGVVWSESRVHIKKGLYLKEEKQ